MQPHFFVSSSDGALYDTRVPDWSHQKPLRPVFSRAFPAINTTAEFKAALRNGAYAWPGGYQMYLICDDGGALCFDCARKNARDILWAIENDKPGSRDCDDWRVMATNINYEDSDLRCDHCSQPIPAAYGSDFDPHDPRGE